MKAKLTLLILSLFILFAQSITAQTLVNRDWSSVTGYLNVDYDFQTSSKDANGNTVVIGNSYNVGEAENFLITKYSPTGTILWQTEYNGVSNKTDFGTDVVCFNNYIYVSGVSWDTVAGVSSFVTLQLNQTNGAILWKKIYRGAFNGYNFPTRLVTDNSGNIYVAGTSQTATNDYAQVTLKYNSTGTLQWTNILDSIGLKDGAGGIRYISASNTVVVYGASGSTTANWDFTILNVNASTGANLDGGRVKNTNAYFAKPTDIVKDANDYIYATGTVTNSAGQTDIKVIKLDTLLNIVWSKTIDGGANKYDEATAMKLDPKGNIVVVGYSTRADNAKEAWLLKLDNAGNTLWDRRRPSLTTGKDAQNKEVDIDKSGNIYTAGKVHNGSNFDFLTQAYDSTGSLKWEKTYTTDSTTDDEAQDISVDTLGGITVSGRNKVGSIWRYTTVKYKQWNPSNNCNSRAVCPTVSYKFNNGKITSLGIDSFVEFDIYAKQSQIGLPYTGGTIIFTYGKTAFGDSLASKGNITITKGIVTANSVYTISARDTLFNSEAVPKNGKEIVLNIQASSATNLYALKDTFLQLCHIKMKLKKLGTLGIKFDKFFMQDKSFYYAGGNIAYNFVNTGGAMAIRSSVDLTYKFAGVTTGGTFNKPSVTFDIVMKANLNNYLSDVGVTVLFDPNVLQLPAAGIKFAPWTDVQYSNSTNTGYVYYKDNPIIDNTNGYFVLQVHSNDPFDPTGGGVFSVHTNSSDGLAQITMGVIKCENPQLSFDSPNIEDNFFSAGKSTILAYNVISNDTYTSQLCACKTNTDPCTGVKVIDTDSPTSKAYPNPFDNKITIEYTMPQAGEVSLIIESVVGQTVLTDFFSSETSGNYSHVVDFPAELPAGLYFIRLKLNNQWNTLKIIKQ